MARELFEYILCSARLTRTLSHPPNFPAGCIAEGSASHSGDNSLEFVNLM